MSISVGAFKLSLLYRKDNVANVRLVIYLVFSELFSSYLFLLIPEHVYHDVVLLCATVDLDGAVVKTVDESKQSLGNRLLVGLDQLYI